MNVSEMLNNLNIVSEKLFQSVEGQVFEVLDHIILIGSDVLKAEPLAHIFQKNSINGIMILAQAMLLFYVVYYIFSELLSLYNGNQTENIYHFILKLILVALLVQNSYFICEQLLNLMDGLSHAIDVFTQSIIHVDANFTNLKENIISMKNFMKNDLLSLDGLIKGIISFGAISILIAFSIRYVTILFLLLVSPLAIVCMTSHITKGIFLSWLKLLMTNLLVGIIVKLIILIPLAYRDTNAVLYKVILVGTIYILYRLQSFIKELLMRFGADQPMRNIFKN